MDTIFAASLFVAVATACAGFATSANAQCVGGSAISGGYSVALQGKLTTGKTEALAGVLQSDGQCNLTGTLYGRIANIPVKAAKVNGSYSVNYDSPGSLTITLSTKKSFTFGIFLQNGGNEIVGLESDGEAQGNLDARKQVLTSFTQSTLLGSYVKLMQPVGKSSINFYLMQYDGVGGASGTEWFYNGNSSTQVVSEPIQIAYNVNSDGSFTETIIDPPGNHWYYGGGIDNGGAGTPAAIISESGGSFVIGAALSLGQKQ